MGGPRLVGRSGALTAPAALLRSGAGAERVKKSNGRSGAVSEVQKIKWSLSAAGAGGRRSGNGAVSWTAVNGAEQWAGNFAAPLRAHALLLGEKNCCFWCLLPTIASLSNKLRNATKGLKVASSLVDVLLDEQDSCLGSCFEDYCWIEVLGDDYARHQAYSGAAFVYLT